MYNIIWPDKRTVADHVILQWAKDGFDNGEIFEQPRNHTHAADLLDKEGLITFGTPMYEPNPKPAWI